MQVIPTNTADPLLCTIFFSLVDATDLVTPENLADVEGVKPAVRVAGVALSGTIPDIVEVDGATGEYSWTPTQSQINQAAGKVLRGSIQPTGCALTKFEAQIGLATTVTAPPTLAEQTAANRDSAIALVKTFARTSNTVGTLTNSAGTPIALTIGVNDELDPIASIT